MRCADARRDLSAMLDGEAPEARTDEVHAHVDGCDACRGYAESLHALRARLRLESVGTVHDLVPAVRARIAELDGSASGPGDGRTPRSRRRTTPRFVPVAAAFVAAFVAGASFVGFVSGPDPVAARDLSGAVLEAQHSVESLTADVVVVERGWHPSVPARRFEGTLAYRAPESLALHLRDVTGYPSGAWVPNDVDLVVDGTSSWERGVARCPQEALPGCTPRTPISRVLVGREPFPDRAPAPLDLVVPVRSFANGGDVEDLGHATAEGRSVVGVRVTVAQVTPLLDGLRAVGNGRPLHPTDAVELWLDRGTLVPVALDVFAPRTVERDEWAARRGLTEPDGSLLSVRFRRLQLGADVGPGAFAPAPPDASVRDAGFLEGDPAALGAADVPAPAWLPSSMALVRSGVVRGVGGPPVAVRAWSDGRAFVKVAATTRWESDRLFGDLGPVVRRVTTERGVAYLDERGERVALHADRLDVVVSGSVSTTDLLRVAASLPVRGADVPPDWEQAGTATLDELVGSEPGLLAPVGHGEPAARRAGDTTTLAYAGPGARGFVVVQAPATRLSPPFDPDARTVPVRGRQARWSPAIGTLEWIEDGRSVALTSRTLSLGELVAVAEGMVRR